MKNGTKTELHVPTRYQLYRHATGDTDWGQAPIWLSKRYFEFHESIGEETPYIQAKPDALPLPMVRNDDQAAFHAWLLEKYWPEAVNGVPYEILSAEAEKYNTMAGASA